MLGSGRDKRGCPDAPAEVREVDDPAVGCRPDPLPAVDWTRKTGECLHRATLKHEGPQAPVRLRRRRDHATILDSAPDLTDALPEVHVSPFQRLPLLGAQP